MSNYLNKETLSSEIEMSSVNMHISNPLCAPIGKAESALTDYSQTLPRKTYDNDMAELLEVVRVLNNMAPTSMPVYNFNVNEINGEHYFKPDGTMLLVREYDSDLIRDYYVSPEDTTKVSRILEHDKTTGRLRAKIEQNTRPTSNAKYNITIFDDKINKKYTLMQLTEDGTVNNITEFSGKGQSFQTLYRNITSLKPARYLEGKDVQGIGFEMIDSIFGNDGNIARIKRYNSKKEIDIEYTADRKNITVKQK